MERLKAEGETSSVVHEAKAMATSQRLNVSRYPIMKVRVMATYMVLLIRLVLPALLSAYRALLRNQRTVVDRLVPAVFAFVANSISVSSLSAKTPEEAPHQGAPPTKALAGPCSAGERCVSCDVLYDPGPGSRRADVVFIHGLHGSLEKTWRQGLWRQHPAVLPVALKRASLATGHPRRPGDGGEGEGGEGGGYSPCWPRDWLPLDCPHVRVIALNYTTDPFLWRPVWIAKNRSNMLQRSREMIEHLLSIGVGDLPIVWVGHSKGGLFIKQMLVDAHESGGDAQAGLHRNTRAIMFYSVPHKGSACADINLPLLRQSVELEEVQKDCQNIMELHSKFLYMMEKNHLRAEIFSFIETIQTFMRLLYIQIVSLESADAGFGQMYGAPLDHRNICKPTNRECFLYKELINLIHKHI